MTADIDELTRARLVVTDIKIDASYHHYEQYDEIRRSLVIDLKIFNEVLKNYMSAGNSPAVNLKKFMADVAYEIKRYDAEELLKGGYQGLKKNKK